MAKDDPKSPEDDPSELVKLKSLAMKIVAVPKDEIYGIEPKPKRKTAKNAAKKSSTKR